jgi:glycosyltransferase involved in cell wall biosynthesis
LKNQGADVLVFKMASYDSASFNASVAQRYPKSIIVNYDFDGIWTVKMPGEDRRGGFRFCEFPRRLGNAGLALAVFINLARQSWMLTRLCVRYRPRIVWIEHTYIAVVAGLLRIFGLCRCSVYSAGDWIAGARSAGFISRFHRNIFFPRMDAWACRLNTAVVNNTVRIGEVRSKFWGRRLPKNETTYVYQPRLMGTIDVDAERFDITFIGTLRIDSGLEILLRALARPMSAAAAPRLIVCGKKSQDFERLEGLVRELGLEQRVDFKGYVPMEALADMTRSSCCGVNLLVAEGTFTTLTIPGKLMTYVQLLLPPIVSCHVGYFADVVAEHELGLVIEPTVEAFAEALARIQRDQRLYRRNILRYIECFKSVDIASVIEPGCQTG